MNILFLDSDKDRQKLFKRKIPGSHVVVVGDSEEFIKELKKQEVWNIVFLGCDVENETVINWIKDNEPQIRNIIVHNHDGVIGTQAVQTLKKQKYEASYLPFSVMMENLEKIK
jgi:rhodanese-related sulfurtransferase